MKPLLLSLLTLAATITAGPLIADDLAEIQRQLNAEVVSKPFDPGEAAKIDAYVEEAMKKDLKPPVVKAPTYWRQGYSCRDAYRHGGYRAYRNCRHYRRYHGRYWY